MPIEQRLAPDSVVSSALNQQDCFFFYNEFCHCNDPGDMLFIGSIKIWEVHECKEANVLQELFGKDTVEYILLPVGRCGIRVSFVGTIMLLIALPLLIGFLVYRWIRRRKAKAI
ncbi:unnamed protein product [Vitrella brassicaformis CCMP3155]|uniref:Uncharacterized protein n=1 Tax=Vitrella brassicaformis (strain CCMP3155) TaxID=1169540 RepID=A0A0G4ENV3_VITBC|nr:unnamed protein product [Vitrella brassicaformis CCMP3155]|eukprot:CEL98943.1 unnamed protein product [Vitrella brassicaformis CCMP3155]